MGYKGQMGNARYFQETLFVKLEHFAKLTFSTPEKVKARLLTFDEVSGTWSGDLAGGEEGGQFWVSSHCLGKGWIKAGKRTSRETAGWGNA